MNHQCIHVTKRGKRCEVMTSDAHLAPDGASRPVYCCPKHVRDCKARGWIAKPEEHERARQILALWDDFEERELVRFRVEADDDCTLDDLGCDGDTPDDRQALAETCNQDGVWGAISECRTSPEEPWEHAESCWGFVGDSWKYFEFEAKASALAQLDKLFAKEAQKLAERATFASGGAPSHEGASSPLVSSPKKKTGHLPGSGQIQAKAKHQ